jgi:hypothetical protein
MRVAQIILASAVFAAVLAAAFASNASAQDRRFTPGAQQLPRLTLHSALVTEEGDAHLPMRLGPLLSLRSYETLSVVHGVRLGGLLNVTSFDRMSENYPLIYRLENTTLVLRPYRMGRTGLRGLRDFDALDRR